MDLHLTGKRALVTGASRGIGEAVAKRLAKEGVLIVVHGRCASDVERVVRDIGYAGGRASAVLGDVADSAQVAASAEKALEAFDGLDILVNNAGVFPNEKWDESGPETWKHVFAVNLQAAVTLSVLLAPGMKERNWGRIINISSILGTRPQPWLAAYASSKAALINLTATQAMDLGPSGITCNAVSPGAIMTERIKPLIFTQAFNVSGKKTRLEMEQAAVEKLASNPIGRFGRPEEVADLVAFIASPRAGFINGANLRIDGGACSLSA